MQAVPERDVALRDPVEEPVRLRLRDDLLLDQGVEARLQVCDKAGLELLPGDALVLGEVADLLAGLEILDQRRGRDAKDVGLRLDDRRADNLGSGCALVEGFAVDALTAPMLRSAATPAAPTALTATAANGLMFVLTSDETCENQIRCAVSEPGRCGVRSL